MTPYNYIKTSICNEPHIRPNNIDIANTRSFTVNNEYPFPEGESFPDGHVFQNEEIEGPVLQHYSLGLIWSDGYGRDKDKRRTIYRLKCVQQQPEGAQKPPIGIIPRWMWIELRIEDIESAIERYKCASVNVPDQWKVELRELNVEKPLLAEVFADNGAHSHWRLIEPSTGVLLWSEAPDEDSKWLAHRQPSPETETADQAMGRLNPYSIEQLDKEISWNEGFTTALAWKEQQEVK